MSIVAKDVSLQLYSLRKLQDPVRIIAAAAMAGYGSVELLAPNLLAYRRTKMLLRSHGIIAPSAHVGLLTLKHQFRRVLDACCELQVSSLIVSSVPRWRRHADEAYWRRTGEVLSELAVRVATEAGLQLGYHNHSWEFRFLPSGNTPLECLFASDPNRLLRWQIDLGWLTYAGQSTRRWLDYGIGRIDSVHMREPNSDFLKLWQQCEDAGARRLIIELDDPGEPEAMCRRCLQTIKYMVPG